MHRLTMLMAAALAGCASSGPGSALPPSPVAQVRDGGTSMRLRPGDGATTHSVALPIDQVWRALPAVYDSLGIEIALIDPSRHLLGNDGFKAHRRLGGVSMSQYLECGRTQNFPSADSYEIHLSVLTELDPAEGGATSIATMVEASARPMSYKGDYTRCSTKGELESRIVAGLRARLQR